METFTSTHRDRNAVAGIVSLILETRYIVVSARIYNRSTMFPSLVGKTIDGRSYETEKREERRTNRFGQCLRTPDGLERRGYRTRGLNLCEIVRNNFEVFVSRTRAFV